MRINYFFRAYHNHQISIEKLFGAIMKSVEKEGAIVNKIVNPYEFSIIGIIKSLLFFKRNQGQINHITGDIHWSCFFLDREKTILTIHDLVGINQYKGFKKWFYYFFWAFLPIKKLKYITVISDKTRDEIVKLMPMAASKIIVIPNMLTIEPIQDNNLKGNKLLNILIVGTRQNKNIERIFEALSSIKAKLTIIGFLSKEQIDMISQYNLDYENLVNISEEILLKSYDNADILCFPSLYEGFGLPILEAQARNCAVITSDLPPMKEVAGNGAILVNPNDPNDIKKAILDLKDETLRLEYVIKGKENIKNYLPEVITKKYMFLYDKILNQKS